MSSKVNRDTIDHSDRELVRGSIARRFDAVYSGDPSKYEVVRRVIEDAAEMNALEARPQGQGIGTAMIQAAELEGARRGAPIIGLAVEVQNDGARRLYERLGYAHWGHGRVIDRWTQRNDHSDVVIEHADECFYLTKQIG